MDEILKIREKHNVPNLSELTERIIDKLITQKKEDEKQQHKVAEQELELRTVASKLKSHCDELDNVNSILESKFEKLQKYKEENEILLSELKSAEAEVLKLQLKMEHLNSKKPNAKDQAIIEQEARKFHLLKEITGIRWNFELLEDSSSGYIHNKKTNYVHNFSVDSKIAGDELANKLWDEIEKSTNPADKKNKE